ncbi:hypothetical protein E2542_SST02510 [Spatholobus suberectus]|nr:hypothetical protein E2542_SST02510 [Spatholobus suberectus]
MQKWWYKRREGTVSQRAIGLKGCASAITTVLRFAMLKASLVANAGDSVDAASAPNDVSWSMQFYLWLPFHLSVSGINK